MVDQLLQHHVDDVGHGVFRLGRGVRHDVQPGEPRRVEWFYVQVAAQGCEDYHARARGLKALEVHQRRRPQDTRVLCNVYPDHLRHIGQRQKIPQTLENLQMDERSHAW